MTEPTPKPAPKTQGEESALFVQSFARGLEVIEAFQPGFGAMTLTEVSAATGYSRATVRRFLHTLVHLGYMRTDGKTFSLTPRVMQLGYAYLASQSLPDVLEPILADLSAELGESTSASVLDGTDVVYIARQQTRRIMHVAITVGTRFPAYATSMGRVLLAGLSEEVLREYFAQVKFVPLTPRTTIDEESLRAELAQIREQGWCLVDQELEIGLRSLAVPVRNRAGEVIAAINTSMSTHLDPEGKELSERVAEVLPKLQAAGQQAGLAF